MTMRPSILLLVLAAPTAAFAGPPQYSHFNASEIVAEDGAVWVVGYDNCDEAGLVEHDISIVGGSKASPLRTATMSRRELLAAAMTATNTRLFAVSRAGDAVYAVGDGGAIVVSNDGGKTWAKRKSDLKGDLRGVWTKSAREAYILTVDMLAATRDGKTWRAIAIPRDFALYSMWGSDDDLYLGGAQRVADKGSTYLGLPQAFVSHDRGKTWREVVTKDDIGPGTPQWFAGLAADDVYGLGGLLGPSVWHSTDRGATWTKIGLPVHYGIPCRGGH
jgi:photosystem II stability/assembly factor-like uncharacterized protein